MSTLTTTPTGWSEHKSHWHWRWWLQWIAANALSEMIGLGLTALIAIRLNLLAEGRSVPVMLLIMGVMILAGGLLEGVLVGVAQWWALRRRLPALSLERWATMTAIGAFVAWTLGMLPSTLIEIWQLDFGADGAAPGEVSDLLLYFLAASLGCFALGPVLSIAQWWELRRHLAGAAWWIPANMLAWAVGMVIIFVAAGTPNDGLTLRTALSLLGMIALAGTVVGAIHGLVLLWLLRRRHDQDTPLSPASSA